MKTVLIKKYNNNNNNNLLESYNPLPKNCIKYDEGFIFRENGSNACLLQWREKSNLTEKSSIF